MNRRPPRWRTSAMPEAHASSAAVSTAPRISMDSAIKAFVKVIGPSSYGRPIPSPSEPAGPDHRKRPRPYAPLHPCPPAGELDVRPGRRYSDPPETLPAPIPVTLIKLDDYTLVRGTRSGPGRCGAPGGW